MSQKALSIHAHFYQPPREDPITKAIPREKGAHPYKNWNERIHDECYQPNADLGNFEHISFDISATLMSWLSAYRPLTYQKILLQNRRNIQRFGVSNALAQPYYHVILPLATTTDKIIQILWGITDFEYRFGYKPRGMWLPETAVDYETLLILAHQGIQYTILAPWQADSNEVDVTQPHWVSLPGGKSIMVFFFQGELSGRISFDPKTTNDVFQFVTNDLINFYREEKVKRGDPQLVLIASDGELYGHHQPHRERFLASLLNGATDKAGLSISFPELWLQTNEVRSKVQIKEGTSWSCFHNLMRWKGECSCCASESKWKYYLRTSLEQLAADLDWIFFESIYPFTSKPRRLRERYIHVMLGEISPDTLITEMTNATLTTEQRNCIYLLLEAQRERQRMFTSCGWFFDEFDRIEPINNIASAAQAVWLTYLATKDDLAPKTVANLTQVVSPTTGLRGDQVFERYLEKAEKHSLQYLLPLQEIKPRV